MSAKPPLMPSLILACSAAFASAAQADVEVIVQPEATFNTPGGYALTMANDNTSQWTLSDSWLGAINASAIRVDPIAPGLVAAITRPSGQYKAINNITPITSLSGILSSNQYPPVLTATGFSTQGGMRLSAIEDDFTNTGGILEISNFRVDLAHHLIYADLQGGNGVGRINNIQLWNVAQYSTNSTIVKGPATCFDMCGNSSVAIATTLTGLSITTSAFDLFSKSLGLTDLGIGAMRQVTDYGSIVTSVPEPSTYLLMGLGLLGLLTLRHARPSSQDRSRRSV